MIEIENYLNSHLAESLPFVLYAKPNSDAIVGFFQQDYHVYQTNDYLDKGFVFAPFDGEENVFFPVENCEVVIDSLTNLEVTFGLYEDDFPSDETKNFHINLVDKGIAAIQSGQLKKVVLSRKETIAIPNIDFMLMYKRLLKAYPTAFRYLFFHPQIGFWMGATPEQLVKQKQQSVYTVALAGTQVKANIKEVVWEEKEKEEQKIVTDFILSSLKPLTSEIKYSEPYTVQAGSLFHIKTDIEATLNQPEDFVAVLKALHPTPALCGMPKQEAKDFISKNEGYDREFYSGFLGELHYNAQTKTVQESDLFVNLRCMQLGFNQVHLYLGGGITASSNPEMEFLETVNKSKTIKKVLA